MRNIPTDLLRTFVTILDLRGYRRAGDQLGRTQPAISLQMKRLQDILGTSLFARNGSLELSPQGEIVAEHARRILALNDALLAELGERSASGSLRLGIPSDYADHFLPHLMPQLAKREPQMTFDVACHLSHILFHGLQENQFDLIVALTPKGQAIGAYQSWPEPLVWVEGRDSPPLGPDRPVRIVSYPEGCLYRRSMLNALEGSGRPSELVYTSPSLAGLQAAVSTGFGVTALSLRIVPKELRIVGPEAGLPALTDAEIGVYIHPRHRNSATVRSLAATFSRLFTELAAAAQRQG